MQAGRKAHSSMAPWVIPTNFAGKLYIQRGLILNFVVRDLKARYAGSIMGLFWSVTHPNVLLSIPSILALASLPVFAADGLFFGKTKREFVDVL